MLDEDLDAVKAKQASFYLFEVVLQHSFPFIRRIT